VATTAVERGYAEPRSRSERVSAMLGKLPIHLILLLVSVIWLVPTVGLLITSFRDKSDIAQTGWWTVFKHPNLTLHNYGEVIHSAGMGHAFLNSLYITVPATLLPLSLGALAAFAFAWIPFPFRDTIFLTIVAIMVVPVQVSFVPLLILFRHLHLNTNFGGIWLVHAAFGLPLAIFLLRNFFITLPKDLIEAAKIDGASNIGILRKVVLPLSVPALASYGIFQFLWVWNDLLEALVFVQDPNKRPMTVKITDLQSTYGVEWHLLSSSAFLLMIVPLIVFFSLQRYFVQGLLAGSVKS
jgi:alpha-glucoside transport system permease protein